MLTESEIRQWKIMKYYSKRVWNMLKVKNKTPERHHWLVPLLLTLNIFHTFFIVFIVDFKQEYVCWVLTTSFLLNLYADINRFMWLKWYVDFDIWEVLPIFKPFEHLQHIQQAIIYSVSTQHDIFSSDFHLISADVSKNNTFIIGFTVNNIKW